MTTKTQQDLPVTESSNGLPDWDFSHLDISGSYAKYEMSQVFPGAYVIVRPANESNPGFWSKYMIRVGNRPRNEKTGMFEQTEEERKAELDDVRDLFPEFIVVDWGGFVTRDGTPVPFSVANCRDLLQKLPDLIIGRLNVFCQLMQNFVAKPGDIPVRDPKALVGN